MFHDEAAEVRVLVKKPRCQMNLWRRISSMNNQQHKKWRKKTPQKQKNKPKKGRSTKQTTQSNEPPLIVRGRQSNGKCNWSVDVIHLSNSSRKAAISTFWQFAALQSLQAQDRDFCLTGFLAAYMTAGGLGFPPQRSSQTWVEYVRTHACSIRGMCFRLFKHQGELYMTRIFFKCHFLLTDKHFAGLYV